MTSRKKLKGVAVISAAFLVALSVAHGGLDFVNFHAATKDADPQAAVTLAKSKKDKLLTVPRSSHLVEDVSVYSTQIEVEADPFHGKPISRSSHGLSVVNHGRRLVLYGGEHAARTPVESDQALWVADFHNTWWNPFKHTGWKWRCVLPKEQPPPRIAHAQASVDDRFVFIFGGRGGVAMQEQAMNDLWKLDTSSLEWTKVEASSSGSLPPEKRSFHRMVAVGRSLYVFGGCGEKHGRLSDLHRFDLDTSTWHNLGSSFLRGRGGPSLLVLGGNTHLAVVGGFAGEETNDGHVYDITNQKWEPALLKELDGLRPRSVSVSGSFPSKGVCVLFGGEVDPSGRGHEGAGDFANDIVLLNCTTAKYLGSVGTVSSGWPPARGWSDAAVQDNADGTSHLYMFGGLSGDDANPVRRDDLWRLDILQKAPRN